MPLYTVKNHRPAWESEGANIRRPKLYAGQPVLEKEGACRFHGGNQQRRRGSYAMLWGKSQRRLPWLRLVEAQRGGEGITVAKDRQTGCIERGEGTTFTKRYPRGCGPGQQR